LKTNTGFKFRGKEGGAVTTIGLIQRSRSSTQRCSKAGSNEPNETDTSWKLGKLGKSLTPRFLEIIERFIVNER
jgi:hypothetical protein